MFAWDAKPERVDELARGSASSYQWAPRQRTLALSPDRPRPPSLPRRGSCCDGAGPWPRLLTKREPVFGAWTQVKVVPH